MASRVIVKNLPKHASDGRLREYFGALGEVTDCKIQRLGAWCGNGVMEGRLFWNIIDMLSQAQPHLLRKTQDGRSRNFAFIGFRIRGMGNAGDFNC